MESKQVVLIILTAMFLVFGYHGYPTKPAEEPPVAAQSKDGVTGWSSPISFSSNPKIESVSDLVSYSV